jgi:hypothetical protein
MWPWITVIVVVVALWLLVRLRSDAGRGPRNVNQAKRDLMERWEDPGNIDRHKRA